MSAIGCAVLEWADGWRGRRLDWSGDIGRSECPWLRGGWRGGEGRACRREKVREGERGLERDGYSERSEGCAGVVSDSCVVGWPDPVNVDAGTYRLACAVGEDGDVSVVTFCANLE